MRVLNVGLMSRWENWATIILMLVIASFAANAISRLLFPQELESK